MCQFKCSPYCSIRRESRKLTTTTQTHAQVPGFNSQSPLI